MKPFATKISALIIATLAIILCLHSLIPYHWGNPLVSAKLNCIDESEVNTVFIGNSRIHHQVIPILFDSIVGTKSFNLASQSASILENSHLLEGFLKTHEVERIIIPYHLFSQIHDRHQHTLRAAYFWDKEMVQASVSEFEKGSEYYKRHIKLYLRKLAFLGSAKGLVSLFVPDPRQGHICENRGFYPIKKNPQAGVPAFEKWFETFQNGITGDESHHYTRNNAITSKYYLKLQRLCDSYDIELFIFFYPNDHTYEQVEFNNEIYLGNGDNFPEYFHKPYWHDRYHMNPAGAKVFTQRLAEKIKGR